jgi:MFS transporter, DHA3 family, macrolide efflux protein
LVDRWSRKWVMVLADTVIALATLALVLLFLFNKAAVWNIYAILLLRSAGSAFHWPAMQATTTLMVPQKHLARVAGMNQTLSGIANIIIPPLGALAIEALPMQSVLAIDIITAVPAIIALLFIPIPQPARSVAQGITNRPSFWADLREGLDFVLRWRGLVLMAVIGILINMLGRAAASFFPLLIFQHLKGGALELGAFQSVIGIGSLVGGLILGAWGGFKRKVVTQMAAMLLDGIAVMALGLSPENCFWFCLVVVFFVGLLETIAIGVGGALFQSIVPPEVQGRVFGLLISLTQALSPLGLIVAGPTAEALGVPFWFVLTGIIFMLIGIAGLSIPEVRHIEDPAYQPSQVREAKLAGSQQTSL